MNAFRFLFCLLLLVGCSGAPFHAGERDSGTWESSDSGTQADVATGGESSVSSATTTSFSTTGGAIASGGSGGVPSATTTDSPSAGYTGLAAGGSDPGTTLETGGSITTGGSTSSGTGGAAIGGTAATGGSSARDVGMCPCPQNPECAPHATGCNPAGTKSSDFNEPFTCVTVETRCTVAKPVFCFQC